MKTNTLPAILMALTLGFSANAMAVGDVDNDQLNSLIDSAATEKQDLVKGLSSLLDEASESKPESREIVEFIEQELDWKKKSEIVDNRQPDSVVKSSFRKEN